MQRVKILIKGKVGQIGFRYFVKQIAKLNGIVGNVCYSINNDILIHASGSKPAIDKLISACRIGPLGATVDEISINPCNFDEPKGFSVIDERNGSLQ